MITVYQREDKRPIQPEDVRRLRASIRIPLKLGMAATDSMLEFASSVKPDYACIVPENRQEVTVTCHGPPLARIKLIHGQEKEFAGSIDMVLQSRGRERGTTQPERGASGARVR